MKMIKVERMPQTVHYSGKTYGPSEKPLSVPEELAAALGLTPVNGSFSPEATAEVDHQELEASRTLATQAKENLDKLVIQLAPLAQEGEMPDQVLARVVSERQHFDKLLKGTADEVLKRGDFVKVPRFDDQHPGGMDVRQAVAAGFDDLKAEADMLRQQVADLTRDLEGKKGETAHAVEQWTATQEQVNALTAQLAEAQARPVLPADARERLVKVKGISDALADQALEALKATPEQPQGG